jgi:hypothetical protein
MGEAFTNAAETVRASSSMVHPHFTRPRDASLQAVMRTARHSSAALLLVGTAIAAILAAFALNSLFQPSLPPSVNSIEIGEPGDDPGGAAGPEPAPEPEPSAGQEQAPRSSPRRRVPAPAPAPAPAPPEPGDDAGED